MALELKGIIPPMVTPLNVDGGLDVKGLERLIEHLINGGVHGIFLLGTNGEAPSLSYALRKELITKACTFIGGRVPVLVGITDTSFDGSLDIAAHSKEAGADAVVVAPPYYLPISQEEMMNYLERLIPQLPLPVMMYNMPSCTKLHLSLETVKKAKELGAIGIKDSSGDMSYFYSLIEAFKESPEFSIIVGTEMFLPETIIYGGHGAVAGGANFLPELFVDLYNASLANNLEDIKILRSKVAFVNNSIYCVGKNASRITKGIKCALSVMDICEDHMALPLRKFENREREKVKEYLDQFAGFQVI
ncbi:MULTISPECIES: dihydrodipicolinate synthase family protein [unclassified Arenibacter]|uniref:dihydrodipicolinate synthase family protein n=1 Tax=unclassified Arenibacter TaxID=2615047 RepID=UPI000E352F66|nr:MULTISPECIES: dihydrodipicolinate synthase family protein [unclassified Arenibacter]MCM4165426.1 dihydrodipicolinate synthase family protein [Arenibacter sp. A80]RFT54897.1 dihydrodipicolinate synthase family protein [Arenibacter sp. P308M17]